ncbi:MAG: hypothetical protein V4608_10310 [Bacteroidota bacterium]
MTDINFNIDQPDLPEERINKHKDFSKLMYNYQLATKPLNKTPLHKYKHRRIYLIILLVLLVMFIIIEVMDKDEKPQEPATQEQIDTPGN